jgi:uncharacterized glyoxalase superfamily protein PhnB
MSDPSMVQGNELHIAARRGHLDAVRLLLERGADPNARDEGDNALPLHFAAGAGHLEIVRALLDAGSDVHGAGDVHEGGVIGWAAGGGHLDVVQLLLARGARHHIFSAIAAGDLDAIRHVVAEDPSALGRRMSRFERNQSPVQFAVSRKRNDIVDLLFELGAERPKPPEPIDPAAFKTGMAKMSESIKTTVPLICVPDVAAALDWYVSIGFTELGRYEDDGVVNFGMVSFGKAEIMFTMHGKPGEHDVSLWFHTDQVDELYRLLRSRPVEFAEEIYDTFYGARQFGICDLNGYTLYFIRPSSLSPSESA